MSIGCHVGMCLAKYLHLLISTCLTFPCQHSPVFFYVIMSGMASFFFHGKWVQIMKFYIFGRHSQFL